MGKDLEEELDLKEGQSKADPDEEVGFVVEEEGEEQEEEAAAPPQKAQELTPEQLRIRELEGEIQALKGNATQQNRQLAERLEQMDKDKEKDVIARFNAQRDRVKAGIKKAKEDGDVEKETELTDVLTKMNAAEMLANSQRREQRQPEQRPQPQQRREPPTDQAREWYLRNRSWFNVDPKATAYARTVDQALYLEGYDKSSRAYFDELDKRVGRVYPTLVNTQGASPVKKPAGSSTAPIARGASPRKSEVTTADGRLKLTPKRHQVANMLGILDDPVKMAAYKKEIKRSNAAGGAN